MSYTEEWNNGIYRVNAQLNKRVIVCVGGGGKTARLIR